MIGDVGRQLEIHTDLRLESSDGWARLVADGRHLQLTTNDTAALAALWAHAAGASGRGGAGSLRDELRRVGAALDQAGLSAELVDSGGSLVQLGRGRGSRGGRLLAGGPHVALGQPRIVGAAVYRYVKGALRHRFGQLGQSP